MAKSPIVASRTSLEQPSADSTKKDQKAFRLGTHYSAQEINAEFDRIHKRINDILVESNALADLPTDGSASNAQICTRVNALASILRSAGLLKSS